mmetsp:Transcript_27224/g.64652  ORF Transcript_27224/g.64652 Transcript_27224/m.64652 type:complete len:118 (-) Transcript_27224:1020-1373(-)
MKLVILLSLASGTSSFVSKSPAEVTTGTTELSAITRRKAITLSSGLLFGALAGPRPSHSSTANPVFEDEINYEPSQQAHGDLLDVNNAFVVRRSYLASSDFNDARCDESRLTLVHVG